MSEVSAEKLNFIHYDIELLNPDALGNPREHFSDEETGECSTSQNHLCTKVTPDLHLTYENQGKSGVGIKRLKVKNSP